MGCWHQNRDARNMIDKLEDEIKDYENFKDEVTAIQDALESYASFLTNLGSQLQDVRVTGYPYDGGKCAANAKKLRDLKDGDLEAMKASADAAIAEINDVDIKAQNDIINNWGECSYCRRARLNAERKDTLGGGPIALQY